MELWVLPFYTLLLFYMNSLQLLASAATNETDRFALLAFKNQITSDPLEFFSSWNESLHFCNWQGVTCSNQNQRVTFLELRELRLVGKISPYLSNLTFLKGIDLRDNNFHGELPQELGRLLQLQHLNLSRNSINGEIPTNLSKCLDLEIINLDANELVGEFPVELTNLLNLALLNLTNNNLTGTISPFMGNLSSLGYLSLARNSLKGSIPPELGRIKNLYFLQLSLNNFSGSVPSSLYNLSSLSTLGMAENQVEGKLPPDIGLLLPRLRSLLLGGNRFSGPIPVSLSNATALERINVGGNELSGGIPSDLGRLQSLTYLRLSSNRLGNGDDKDLDFISSLTNCTRLNSFGIERNRLSGRFPESIANLSAQLTWLIMGGNQIFGRIPESIDNLEGLIVFDAQENLLTGTIPLGIGKLQNLVILGLSRNIISGPIPSTLCNNTQLVYLYLARNNLEGNIPSSLGDCINLQELVVTRNKLNGTIPREVFLIPSLSVLFSLSYNSLSGPLPSEVGSLKNLGILYLSDNKLSGEIPSSLGDCQDLEILDMGRNFFRGELPASLSNLKGIQQLDLSANNLSGQIPEYLENLKGLQLLNLSFNDFEGEVPKEGVFQNTSRISVRGNNKLCGGLPSLQFPACALKAPKRTGNSANLKVIIPAICASVFLLSLMCFLAVFYRKIRSKKEGPPSMVAASLDNFMKISYRDLVKATNDFSNANLVGVGSYGSVYKGILEEENAHVVAVKVLNLQRHGASKSFIAECDALRNIRHRNLVKILTACSSVDYIGNDFKALVFEFMPSGNLETWLHPKTDEQGKLKNLNLIQRLNVAIDIASALEYLHNQCQTPIVHCDLKPSNVLLDEEMGAHVGDFGLARFLTETTNNLSQNQSISAAIKGTIGYVAPEYGTGGKVSTQVDVYSYGILLLEMFTGKRPTAEMFTDGLSLRRYVEMALPERLADVVDLRLLMDGEEDKSCTKGGGKLMEFLALVLKIGLACSVDSPKERLEMGEVVREMALIRQLFLRSNILDTSINACKYF